MAIRPALIHDDSSPLIEALTTAVLVADADRRVTRMNAAAENLLGASATKVIGRSLHTVFAANPAFLRIVDAAVREGRSFTERDFELMPANLQPALVDCTVSPWFATDDERTQIVSSSRASHGTSAFSSKRR